MPKILFLCFLNSDPPSEFVKKSLAISAVGQYSILIDPSLTLLVIEVPDRNVSGSLSA